VRLPDFVFIGNYPPSPAATGISRMPPAGNWGQVETSFGAAATLLTRRHDAR
jgi:hypothetical protein